MMVTEPGIADLGIDPLKISAALPEGKGTKVDAWLTAMFP